MIPSLTLFQIKSSLTGPVAFVDQIIMEKGLCHFLAVVWAALPAESLKLQFHDRNLDMNKKMVPKSFMIVNEIRS